MSTYNAQARPEDVLRTWKHFQQKELQGEVFMAFGYGDGGGGPTREMAENLREMAACPGLPQVRQRDAGDFFRDLERDSGAKLPVWDGELYLELHRGTYTTQSRNKAANRKSEFLLHDAEFLAAFASQLDPGYRYPAETFNQAWRLVCLNQFHDVIPGSSIGSVYAESQRQYAEIRRLATGARRGPGSHRGSTVGGDVLLINPTGFTRRDPAWWPGTAAAPGRCTDGAQLLRPDGQPVLTQAAEAGAWLAAGELPPYSVTPLRLEPALPRRRLPQPPTLGSHLLPPGLRVGAGSAALPGKG